jgi:hypothetical protein
MSIIIVILLAPAAVQLDPASPATGPAEESSGFPGLASFAS